MKNDNLLDKIVTLIEIETKKRPVSVAEVAETLFDAAQRVYRTTHNASDTIEFFQEQLPKIYYNSSQEQGDDPRIYGLPRDVTVSINDAESLLKSRNFVGLWMCFTESFMHPDDRYMVSIIRITRAVIPRMENTLKMTEHLRYYLERENGNKQRERRTYIRYKTASNLFAGSNSSKGLSRNMIVESVTLREGNIIRIYGKKQNQTENSVETRNFHMEPYVGNIRKLVKTLGCHNKRYESPPKSPPERDRNPHNM